jgi:hypothetical protein
MHAERLELAAALLLCKYTHCDLSRVLARGFLWAEGHQASLGCLSTLAMSLERRVAQKLVPIRHHLIAGCACCLRSTAASTPPPSPALTTELATLVGVDPSKNSLSGLVQDGADITIDVCRLYMQSFHVIPISTAIVTISHRDTVAPMVALELKG